MADINFWKRLIFFDGKDYEISSTKKCPCRSISNCKHPGAMNAACNGGGGFPRHCPLRKIVPTFDSMAMHLYVGAWRAVTSPKKKGFFTHWGTVWGKYKEKV